MLMCWDGSQDCGIRMGGIQLGWANFIDTGLPKRFGIQYVSSGVWSDPTSLLHWLTEIWTQKWPILNEFEMPKIAWHHIVGENINLLGEIRILQFSCNTLPCYYVSQRIHPSPRLGEIHCQGEPQHLLKILWYIFTLCILGVAVGITASELNSLGVMDLRILRAKWWHLVTKIKVKEIIIISCIPKAVASF